MTALSHGGEECLSAEEGPAEPEAGCPHFPLQISLPSVSRSSFSSVAFEVVLRQAVKCSLVFYQASGPENCHLSYVTAAAGHTPG